MISLGPAMLHDNEGPGADNRFAVAGAVWRPEAASGLAGGCPGELDSSTRAFLPTAVAPMTAAAATALSRLTCSPSRAADQPSVRAGWAIWSRPTRATPPMAI